MLKFIIFDWDGTLNDSMESVYKAYSVHSGKSLDYIRKNFDPDWKAFIKKENIPKMTFEMWNEFMEKFGTEFFPGAAECIKKLKKDGFILTIASSSPLYDIKKKLSEENLLDSFGTLITNDMVEKLKPDPECLIAVLKKLNAKAEDCVFVGDACVDAIAASRIGMKFIGVSWGFQNREELEQVESIKIVNDFDELYNLIKSL